MFTFRPGYSRIASQDSSHALPAPDDEETSHPTAAAAAASTAPPPATYDRPASPSSTCAPPSPTTDVLLCVIHPRAPASSHGSPTEQQQPPSRPLRFRDIKLVGTPVESEAVRSERGGDSPGGGGGDEVEAGLVTIRHEGKGEEGSEDGGETAASGATGSPSSPSFSSGAGSAAPRKIEQPPSPTKEYVAVPGKPIPEPLVDVVHSSTEDPFTIESFEASIRSHARVGKDFIIARVTTVDSSGSCGEGDGGDGGGGGGERRLHHHYAAHQINKVLFRTQPEDGLLHRMKAKNPLNNLTIVGDVHYFAVRSDHVIALLNRLHLRHQHRRASASTASRRLSSSATSTLHPSLSAAHLAGTRLSRNLARLVHGLVSPALDIVIPAASSAGRRSVAELAGGVFARRSDGGEAGRRRRRAPNEGHDDDDEEEGRLTPPPESSPLLDDYRAHLRSLWGSVDDDGVDSGGGGNGLARGGEGRGGGGDTTPLGGRRRSADDVFALTPNAPSKSPTPTTTTITARLPRSETVPIKSEHLLHFDLSHPPSTTTTFDDDFYIADYIGSDDDFLYKAEVRAYFRKHALEPDDAVLFTLPPDPSVGDLGGSDGERGGEGGERRGEQEGWLLKGRPFWMVTGGYGLFCLVLIKSVPQAYMFITAFTLSFTYCVFLIIIMP